MGIGTNIPGERLELAGDFLLSSGAHRTIYVGSEIGAGFNLTIQAGSGGTPGPGGSLFLAGGSSGDGGGQVFIFGGTGGAGPVGDVILAHTGTAARGNVGIGTNSPGAELDVRGVTNTSLSLGNPAVSGVGVFLDFNLNATSSASTIREIAGGTTRAQIILGNQFNDSFWDYPSGGSLNIRTGVGGTTAVRITSAALELSGGELRLNDSDNSSKIRCGAANTSTSGHCLISARDGDNMFRFFTDTATAQFNTNEGGGWSSAAFDYAEKFPYKDETIIQKGDLVSAIFESGQIEVLDRSSVPYDHRLTGIVSTQPGFIGGVPWLEGDSPESIAPNLDKAVSLVGRVPTKVSTLNGPIEVGDRVTTSNLSGVGMKTTKAGVVAGHALQEFNPDPATCKPANSLQEISWVDFPPGTDHVKYTEECFKLFDGTLVGKIIVFVNIGWFDPSVFLAADGELAQQNPDGTTEKIIAGEIEAERGIFQTLRVKVEAVFLTLRVEVAEIASAVIQNLTVKTLAVKGDATGTAAIKAGETEVVILSSVVTQDSRVFTSPVTPTGGNMLIIGEKIPGQSFEVYIEGTTESDTIFDYWIVN